MRILFSRYARTPFSARSCFKQFAVEHRQGSRISESHKARHGPWCNILMAQLGHSIDDMHVAVVKSGLGNRDVRQREEMRHIFTFKALAPLGINRDFSFL